MSGPDFVPDMRALILGAGLMGRFHAQYADKIGAQIVGVVDLDLDRATVLAEKYQVSAFDGLPKALAASRPDIVHVCTPASAHDEAIQTAIESGVHMLVEKPLSQSFDRTASLLARASAENLVLSPVHQLAFQSWIQEVGAVGRIVDICYETCSAGAEGASPEAQDQVVDDILPHPLALFERILPGSTDEDWAVLRPASGEFRAHTDHDGVILSIALSMHGRPPRHGLRVTGDQGTLVADLFHGFAVRELGSASRAYKVLRPFVLGGQQLGTAGSNLGRRILAKESGYPGLIQQIRAVYSQVRGGPCALSHSHILGVAKSRDRLRNGRMP